MSGQGEQRWVFAPLHGRSAQFRYVVASVSKIYVHMPTIPLLRSSFSAKLPMPSRPD
jgi:hypothetical protein